ncbi:hypothetical protein MKX01_021681, partial [Papaver californicum]
MLHEEQYGKFFAAPIYAGSISMLLHCSTVNSISGFEITQYLTKIVYSKFQLLSYADLHSSPFLPPPLKPTPYSRRRRRKDTNLSVLEGGTRSGIR